MDSLQNWKDPQSGGVRMSNLLGRLSEWVRGRHKPAIHKTLCKDVVIKPQHVGGRQGRPVQCLTSHNPDHVRAGVVLRDPHHRLYEVTFLRGHLRCQVFVVFCEL